MLLDECVALGDQFLILTFSDISDHGWPSVRSTHRGVVPSENGFSPRQAVALPLLEHALGSGLPVAGGSGEEKVTVLLRRSIGGARFMAAPAATVPVGVIATLNRQLEFTALPEGFNGFR
ncbi:hypothetical protein [Mycobacteroides chelonae]|uniref:hypothetical protein n=1 Tax=Mycobacteroides chelonae TaxID=1774 RepID=UPI0012FF74CD|nr:hypothetical protein [Mycobacteroides chelonae]